MFGSTNMLVLKTTRDCNLRCSYCYVKNKDNYKGERIDFELFKKTIDKIIIDRLKNNVKPHERFSLIFHGGEPLLFNSLQLAKMFEYASNKFINNHITYDLGMQTNLTLLNEDVCATLNQYNVSLGISFDGIEDGNLARTSAYDLGDFESKFKMLDDFSVKYSFLMVGSESNIEKIKESVDFLREKYNIPGIKINYAEDVNNVGGEVSGEKFLEYGWKPFIDEFLETGTLIEDNLKRTVEQFIIQSLSVTLNDQTSNCGLKICGGGIRIVEMNPDGSIYLCGRYSEDFPEAFIKHVLDDDFLELQQIKKYLWFVKQKHYIINEVGCDTCYADKICDHGCMAFHFSKFGEYGIRKDLVCEIFKPLYRYLLLKQYDIVYKYYEMNSDTKGEMKINPNQTVITLKNESMLVGELEKNGISLKFENSELVLYKKIIRS